MASINDLKYRSLINETSAATLDRTIQEIQEQYGDTVSVEDKNKSLRKWGKNIDLNSSSYETLWIRGGNETLPTTNSINTASSSSAGDNQTMVIEGHTVVGTGENAKYTFVIQSVTLNGRSKVVLDIPLARSNRMYNADSYDLSGTVYVYEDDSISNGVPDTESKIHLETDSNQSFKAATTISDKDYWIIDQVFAGVNKRASDSVDFLVEIRAPGKVFRQALPIIASSSGSGLPIMLSQPIIVPKNNDVRIVAQSGVNGTEAAAWISGHLASVI